MPKISELPEIVEPTGRETVTVLDQGVTKRVVMDKLAEASVGHLAGFRSVASYAEREAIPLQQRRAGLHVYVLEAEREFVWTPDLYAPAAWVGLKNQEESTRLDLMHGGLGQDKVYGLTGTLDALREADASAATVKIGGLRAELLTGGATAVAWTRDGARPDAQEVSWAGWSVPLRGDVERFEPHDWALSAVTQLFVAGNSLSDPTGIDDQWSQLLAAALGVPLVSTARGSSDARQVYKAGAKPLRLTLAGPLPASGSVAVTAINGKPPSMDASVNPASFLNSYAGDSTPASATGWASDGRMNVRVTVSILRSDSISYRMSQAGNTAVTFAGPVLFIPDAAQELPRSLVGLWLGNNYFYSGVPNQYGDYTNPQMWEDLDALVRQAAGARIFILPMLPAAEWTERGPGTPYNAYLAARARTKARYPRYWLTDAQGRDLVEYLQQMGSDGSAEDLQDVAAGFTPRSCRYDGLHLNAKGVGLVVQFVQAALAVQALPPALVLGNTVRVAATGGGSADSAVGVVRPSRESAARAVIEAANANPNLCQDPELEFLDVGAVQNWGGTPLAVVEQFGGKRLRTPVYAGSALGITDSPARAIPVTALPSGRVSASFVVARKDATRNPGDLRMRLLALDASGGLLAWPDTSTSDTPSTPIYFDRNTPVAAISAPTEIVIAQNVPLPEGTAKVQFMLRVETVGTTATMDFSHLCVRDGADPHYRAPRVTPKAVSDVAAAAAAVRTEVAGAQTLALAALAAVPAEDAPNYAAQLPNCFTAAEVDVRSMRYSAGTSNQLVPSTFGADMRPCWSLVAPAGGTAEFGTFFGNIPRADIANGSGIFSAALQVYGLDAYAGTTGSQSARILVIQRDAGGVEIAGTRATLAATVTGPGWMRRSGIALHADTANILIYVGVQNLGGTAPRTIRFGDLLLAPGANATFRRPPALPAPTVTAAPVTVYVGPNGNNAAAGTLAAPMATIQAAINKLGGNGTVVLLRGTYTNAQRINPTTITGKVQLVGERGTGTAYDSYPVIYLASKVAGITKTPGFTKVYQANVAGLPALADFNWAYQDGVADPRTAIAVADRSPQHRGRSHRLHWATRLIKTAATTLNAALAEIEAAGANDPRAFVDNGVLYFSVVGGGDATNADIYLDAAGGLFPGAARESCGEIELQNLEVRYGGVSLVPFRRAQVDELFVFGARLNALDYSTLSIGTLECACAGSAGGLLGDGLNGHNGAKLLSVSDYYGHDCRDDGYSDHEGCTTRWLGGGLVEFNGGTGCAPAYGADDVIANVVSRKNQQRGTYKKAGMYVTGDPTASGAADGGYDTHAVFLHCISIGDIVGFADDRDQRSTKAVCIDCKVYDQTGAYGYDVAEMRDCSWSGTGIPRRTNGSATIVKNTALVAA
jgi:hypothetical protein